jgi:hypothetical protein
MKQFKDYYGFDEKDVRAVIHTPVRQARNVYTAGRSLVTYKALGVVIYLFSFVAFYKSFNTPQMKWIPIGFGLCCLLFGSYLIINKK